MINENYLPDFDAMDALAKVIAQYKLDADKYKFSLETYIADCVKNAYLNRECWINGKPPTQTYIDNVVKCVGNSPEDSKVIQDLTEKYRTSQRSAEEAGNLLETMRNKVSVFQTVSANKRNNVQ